MTRVWLVRRRNEKEEAEEVTNDSLAAAATVVPLAVQARDVVVLVGRHESGPGLVANVPALGRNNNDCQLLGRNQLELLLLRILGINVEPNAARTNGCRPVRMFCGTLNERVVLVVVVVPQTTRSSRPIIRAAPQLSVWLPTITHVCGCLDRAFSGNGGIFKEEDESSTMDPWNEWCVWFLDGRTPRPPNVTLTTHLSIH